jgi:hypothetical protein
MHAYIHIHAYTYTYTLLQEECFVHLRSGIDIMEAQNSKPCKLSSLSDDDSYKEHGGEGEYLHMKCVCVCVCVHMYV